MSRTLNNLLPAAHNPTRGDALGEARDPIKLFHQYSGGKIDGSIYSGDALLFMKSLPSGSAKIVFLDPPFNLGKIYNQSRRSLDLKPEAEYQRWMFHILDECGRVLHDGGVLYLYHIPKWAMRLGAYLEETLVFRQWIAISMKNGFARGNRLYPAHYALLSFSKGEPSVSNRPKLQPALCRHCGEYIKDYGGYKSIIDAKGINLSDVWDDVSPVRHAATKNRNANELSPVIFVRVMDISAEPGSLYVDPFAGAGGGVIAASKVGMRFSACDLFESNCRLIVKRLEQVNSYEETLGTQVEDSTVRAPKGAGSARHRKKPHTKGEPEPPAERETLHNDEQSTRMREPPSSHDIRVHSEALTRKASPPNPR